MPDVLTVKRLSIPPYETALRLSVRALLDEIEASISDPHEYIPSRIRHQSREVRTVLDYIDHVERR